MPAIHDLRGKVEDEILRKLEVLNVDQIIKFNLKYINLDKIIENISKEARTLCLIVPENNIGNITDILKKKSVISPRTSVIVMISSKLDADEMIVAMARDTQSFPQSS